MVTYQPRVDIPACAGGKPVRDNFLPFSSPKLSDSEIQAVVDTLRSGWLTTAGRTREFENNFASYVETENCVGLNSCTAGLFLSLKVLEIEPGDEVITTPLTFASSVNVIEHLGARPIFADVDPQTGNINPENISSAITDKTRAILPVHLYGRPCNMTAIRDIATTNGLSIIQDCAHAIETEWDGRKVATYGDICAYSFYATKNITTGEGGMIATDREEWADKIRILALHGLDKSAYDRYSSGGKSSYDLEAPGYKFNMPDISAALGIEGLRRIDERHRRRAEICDMYTAALHDLPGLTLPPEPEQDTRHARHLFPVLVNSETSGISRGKFIEALADENIGSGIHFTPVHCFSYYREKYGYKAGDYPNALYIGENTCSLPLTPYLGNADVEDVITAVRKIILHFSSMK